MTILETLKSSFQRFFDTFATSLPSLVNALVVLILGWLFAKLIKFIATKGLEAVNFNGICEKVGLTDLINKSGLNKTPSSFVASLFHWIIMFIVLTAFFNTLGLTVVADLLNNVVLFIPNIIVACLLLVIGMYLSDIIRSVVVSSLKAANVSSAETIGKVAKGIVLFFVGGIILSQVGIGGAIVTNLMTSVFAALALALGLSFGLGGQETAKKLLTRFFK